MANWLRMVLALVVGAHGLGHVLFLVSLLGVADWGQSAHSWLLGDGWLAKGLGSVIWIVVMVVLTAVAIGLFQSTNWWRMMAVGAAAVSSLGLLLFWAVPATSPATSALVFNLLVLGSLLVWHWPPATQPVS